MNKMMIKHDVLHGIFIGLNPSCIFGQAQRDLGPPLGSKSGGALDGRTGRWGLRYGVWYNGCDRSFFTSPNEKNW